MLTYENIQKICTEFINDSDTVIGMENDWHDMMVQDVALDYSAEDIMKALKVDISEHVVKVPVIFKYRGAEEECDVYVNIYDRKIAISTKERLLAG